jgi:hypothetical protein
VDESLLSVPSKCVSKVSNTGNSAAAQASVTMLNIEASNVGLPARPCTIRV